jgi:hypothetical protein
MTFSYGQSTVLRPNAKNTVFLIALPQTADERAYAPGRLSEKQKCRAKQLPGVKTVDPK